GGGGPPGAGRSRGPRRARHRPRVARPRCGRRGRVRAGGPPRRLLVREPARRPGHLRSGPPRRAVAVTPAPRRVAVLDLGSTSARLVASDLAPGGQLRILASSRAALRLGKDGDRGHRLAPETVALVVDTLRDFRALALGAGVETIRGVATAALRDAENGP